MSRSRNWDEDLEESEANLIRRGKHKDYDNRHKFVCSTCMSVWTSHKLCHCAMCHNSFSSETAFSKHFVGLYCSTDRLEELIASGKLTRDENSVVRFPSSEDFTWVKPENYAVKEEDSLISLKWDI